VPIDPHQTTLIPWVQSVVIKHYILGREELFHGQGNYIALYRYLDNFLALYLMLSLCHTIGDDLDQPMPRTLHLL
jgi:hypothetical protein